MLDLILLDFIMSHFLMTNLVKKSEKKIRKALEDAKKQSAIWCKHIPKPTVSADSLITPEDAKEYIKQCLACVENRLIEMAQKFSPIQWLWYLRIFPHLHNIEDFGFEGYSQTLATILSAQSQRKNDSRQFDTLLSFPLTEPIANYVLAFVAGVYNLADLHIHYGAASREIPFKIMGKRLPEPVPTKSKKEAAAIFDARSENKGFLSVYPNVGIIESYDNSPDKPEIYFLHKFYRPIDTPLPYFEFHDLITPPIPTYYRPIQAELKAISHLYILTENGNGQWLNQEVFSLMLLAGLLFPIAISAPEHSICIAMSGYSVHELDDFMLDYWDIFNELVLAIKELFPDADLPQHPIHLINILKNLNTSSHPIQPGVIFMDEEWVIIDHSNVGTRLEKLLNFPNLGGKAGNQRGIHFENAIQSYIDESPWKPSNELRVMRQIHLLRSIDGKPNQITDIDAIGEFGDTLLIISCKAVIFNVGQDIGEYHALKNARLRIDEAVQKWQDVKAELLNTPIGKNYDFSRYSKIIAIVCTPHIVYTESELSLAYEVTELRKAATASELVEWLNT